MSAGKVSTLDGWQRGNLKVGRTVARRDRLTNRFVVLGRIVAVEAKGGRMIARTQNGNGVPVGRGNFWTKGQ